MAGERAWLYGPRFVGWMEEQGIIARPDLQYGAVHARTIRRWRNERRRHGPVLVSLSVADRFLVEIGEGGSLATAPTDVWAVAPTGWTQERHPRDHYREVKPVALALLATGARPSRVARLLSVTESTIFNWRAEAEQIPPAYARAGLALKGLVSALERMKESKP